LRDIILGDAKVPSAPSLEGSVMDRKKGIPEFSATKQRVGDIGAVLSTRGCSDKVEHVENYRNISIPGTNKAGAESVTRTSKREI